MDYVSYIQNSGGDDVVKWALWFSDNDGTAGQWQAVPKRDNRLLVAFSSGVSFGPLYWIIWAFGPPQIGMRYDITNDPYTPPSLSVLILKRSQIGPVIDGPIWMEQTTDWIGSLGFGCLEIWCPCGVPKGHL